VVTLEIGALVGVIVVGAIAELVMVVPDPENVTGGSFDLSESLPIETSDIAM
jgi:hypothetical protein